MALLHLLANCDRDLELCAAHFDHGLRAGSAAEAATVVAWSADLGIECVVGRPAHPLAGARQAEFRAHRYGWLHSECDRFEADRVATGHQADDQAETVLMRILRGTGLRGLGGIPRQRGAVVRPLLDCTAEQVSEYIDRHRIPHLTDPSNADPKWTRTRVRLELLPRLERSVDASIRERLVALSEVSRTADAALERRARVLDSECLRDEGPDFAGVRLDREILIGAPSGLIARVVRAHTAARGVELTRGGTDAAVRFVQSAPSGATMDLGGGLVLSREYHEIVMSRCSRPLPDRPVVIQGSAPGVARLVLGGRPFDVRWSGGGAPAIKGRRIALPSGWRHYPLSIRARREGDRIQLTAGTRSLKRLYSDRKIPLSDRPTVPVLQDSWGRVLWVAGVATDARLRRASETSDQVVIAIDEV
jgi:tRNA(Ile)-lysidine synthase